MKNLLLGLNDIAWLVTAIYYLIADETNVAMTSLVVITTTVYTIDLFIKFKEMQFAVRPFLKKYWLDLLFLIPFVKLMRGVRIFRSGRIFFNLMRVVDSSSDVCEIAFRLVNSLKKRFLTKGTDVV